MPIVTIRGLGGDTSTGGGGGGYGTRSRMD